MQQAVQRSPEGQTDATGGGGEEDRLGGAPPGCEADGATPLPGKGVVVALWIRSPSQRLVPGPSNPAPAGQRRHR